MTCVYVIGAEEGGGPWKIGLSTNIPDRLATLQSGSPMRLAIKCAYQLSDLSNAQKIERFAHDILAPHRTHGEWFKAELAQVLNVVSKAAALLGGTSIGPEPERTNQRRYQKWREANPELYKQRQRELMRKKRAKDKKAAE